MIPIYHFFTFWALLFSFFEKKTNIFVFPSIVISLIVSTLLTLHYSVSTGIFFINIFLHSLPLLWISINCNNRVLFINLLIAFIYLAVIYIFKTTPQKIYQEQFEYLSKQDIPSLIKTHGNICIFC